jgi:hypothetical protein
MREGSRSQIAANDPQRPPGHLFEKSAVLSQRAEVLSESVRGAGKGHEAYEDNGAHPRLTRCDLFDNGELLWRVGRPQRHDEPTTNFELFNQRRRDMPKCGCHDYGVERTAFRHPS